ncbi:MAG TPA: metallophosphoesterase [Bacteroidota bacterium]|nr:metallophosphoesterase [Bacteroidota bacterium]
MRVLAFTDIHGSVDVVEEILTRERDCDVVLVGGDITTGGSAEDLERSIRRIQSYGHPVLAVLGNMDPPALEKRTAGLGISLDGRGIQIGEVGFFGVSAAPFSPLHTPYEISEEEIARRAARGWEQARGARWTVFIPHAPPRNTALDRIYSQEHVGSTAVRSFIEEHQPDLVVCGHIHEARGADHLGRTKMINCGQAGMGYYGVLTIGKQVLAECRSLKAPAA